MSTLDEIRQERAARWQSSKVSDTQARVRSRSPRQVSGSTSCPNELRVLSWNIDGLDDSSNEEDMLGRTLWVIKEINELRPHVVFLQELIDFNFQILDRALSKSFHICRQESPKQPYFVAILVHKASTEISSPPRTIPFPASKMGRAAVFVSVHLKGSSHKVGCITAHLESLRESATERKHQISICASNITALIKDCSVDSIVLGGDLNIRDTEVPPEWTQKDCWSACGADKKNQFTWDLSRNDNARMPNGAKPKCRFDRMYCFNSASGPRLDTVKFELSGTKRVEGLDRFASDHFGIFATFHIITS